jgi:GNAT superfamily N-acetyltransferase
LTELRRPALLDTRRHDREQFESGEPVLDEWLRRYAGQNRRRDTAATWVIADANDIVVAYASVAMTSIDRSAAPELIAKGAPDPVPALLLGRLAVDHRYSRLGIGTALVAHVLATVVELNEKAACRAVADDSGSGSDFCFGSRFWCEHSTGQQTGRGSSSSVREECEASAVSGAHD